jgi:DNA-nicking Smr family endonuclease
MRRRRIQSAPPGPSAKGFHHHPFHQLASGTGGARRSAPSVPDPKPEPPKKLAAASDAALFEQEMAGVRPLTAESGRRVPVAPPTPVPRPLTDPDAEVIAELSDLVGGAGKFDISDTTEFVEGAVVGIDHRLIRRLRNGEFATQGYLDLHGMTAERARAAVDAFLSDAYQRGRRCVLIIHGRGLNSKDQFPVLKHRLAAWLARTTWARLVLAFTSARPCDGGAGALYVLLRRQRHGKQPIRVTQGAKW